MFRPFAFLIVACSGSDREALPDTDGAADTSTVDDTGGEDTASSDDTAASDDTGRGDDTSTGEDTGTGDDTGPGDTGGDDTAGESPDGPLVPIEADATIATLIESSGMGQRLIPSGNLGGDERAWLITSYQDAYALVPIPASGTALVEDTSTALLDMNSSIARRPLLVTDLTGDGWDDLVVSDGVDCYVDETTFLYTYCNAAIRVVAGPLSGVVSPEEDAYVTLIGREVADADIVTASAVMPGDMDGDGTPDLLMAVDAALLRVPTESSGEHGHRTAEVFVESARTLIGVPLAPGDLDGDGLPELVSNDGAAIIFEAPLSLPASAADAEAIVTGSDASASAAGDLDGDGYGDLVFTGASDLFVLFGPVATGRAEALLGARLIGSFRPQPTVADLDGDGRAEIVLTQVDEERSEGVVYVFAGPLSGTRDLPTADVRLHGDLYFAYSHAEVDIVGGALPLAVGAPAWSDLAPGRGAVLFLDSPL